MRYNLNRRDGLNFGKGGVYLLQPFVPEGKPPNYYDHTRKGLGYVTLPPQSEPGTDGILPSQSSYSSSWDFDGSVGVEIS